MSSAYILLVIVLYFIVLLGVSYWVSRGDDSNEAFFRAKKQSPWYVVAFGMIGATLSGVTFISVPGTVGSIGFGYMQAVAGFFVGTLVIVYVLLPLYYKLDVTSIYQYLDKRFGKTGYRTGAFYFLLSRITGASFRLFLVALTLQYVVFDEWKVPFWLTVVLSVLLIWVYTYRSGMKVIVWTDTLQTAAMLTAVGLAIYMLTKQMGWNLTDMYTSEEFSKYSKWLYFDDPNAKIYFWKYFIGGAFIAITMTGLDQDMMQKNLTVRSLKDSQKNMMSMISLLIPVNFAFLSLGALLYIYADKNLIPIPVHEGHVRADLLFPEIALHHNLGMPLALSFVIGLIAAAYSSADSALTSLTTSISVDFLDIAHKPEAVRKKWRKRVHIAVSVVLILVVLMFKQLDGSVVNNLFTFATFTYGPLLGMFAFGIFTRRKVKDRLILWVSIASILISFGIYNLPESVIGAYRFHWEILPLNGMITFAGLYLISEKAKTT